VGDFRNNVINILDLDYATTVKDATKEQLYNAVSKAVIRNIKERCDDSYKAEKTICPISMEYALGNPIYTNLFSTGLYGQFAELLTENGKDTEMFEYENDLGYGFTKQGFVIESLMESASTSAIDMYGYGLRYKFGYYRQCVDNGKVSEQIDRWWNPYEPWSERVESEKVRVDFKDQSVYAIPYDIYIVGQGAKKVNTMRFWQAEPITEFDRSIFYSKKYEKAFKERELAESLTLLFLENDENEEISILKLRQEYFLVSASIKDIVRKYNKKEHSDFSKFISKYAITISGDACIIAIPELLRVLVEEENMTANKSLKIVKEVFSYISLDKVTRKIDYRLLKSIVPSLCKYINVIQKDFIKKNEQVDSNYIIDNESIHMSNILSYICTDSKIKNDFKEITQREWLYLINKELSFFLTDKIGNTWITSMERIKEIQRFLEDETTIEEIEDIKTIKKRQLSDYIYKKEKIQINKEFVFRYITKDIEKSLMTIKDICSKIKEGKVTDFTPTVYLFKLKPLPYDLDNKSLIEDIISYANEINNDISLDKMIKIVFLHDYNVTYEKKVIPAIDIIDSDDDNRFFLNGAVYKDIADITVEDKKVLARKRIENIINTSGLSVDNVVNRFCNDIWKI